MLKNNKHPNTHLQYSFNKYGEENFKFEILEEWGEDFLNSMENYWCNLLNTHNRDCGFNLFPIKVSELEVKYSKEVRQKMSDSHKGAIVSKETRKKQSDVRKGKPIHTEESKAKIILSNKTRIISEETRLKMSNSAKKRIERIGSNIEEYNRKRKNQ